MLNLNENFNDNCSLHTAAPRPILERLVNRHRDFTEPLPVRVAMGTYNINGGKHFRSIVYKNVSLSDWIYAHRQNGKRGELGKMVPLATTFILIHPRQTTRATISGSTYTPSASRRWSTSTPRTS